VDAVKPRRYDASGRRVQARLNREGIVAAARQRFLSEGFSATTLTAIATDAGASVDTIYKSFGGKAGLLREVCQVALKGEDPVPAEDRSNALQASEADPREVLRGLGALTAEVAPRIAPLLLMLAAAAETDAAMAQLRAEFDASRLSRMNHIAQTLASKTNLRPGVSSAQAAEIMWVYSSPELYGLLVLTRGWRPERFGEFVGESLNNALLGQQHAETHAQPNCRI